MTTEKDLQNLFYKHNWQKYELIAANIFINWGANEMDILGLRKSGYVDEIEIKLSMKDYKQDFIKTVKIKRENTDKGYPLYDKMQKHDALEKGLTHCNYFWFLLPENLINSQDVPSYAGILIYHTDNAGKIRIKRERSPKLLHKRKLS